MREYKNNPLQAIVTKYIGPSNMRGSRIKASAAVGSLTVSYSHALNAEDNHRAAAIALANKYGWIDHATLHMGGTPDSCGYVFVMIHKGEAQSLAVFFKEGEE